MTTMRFGLKWGHIRLVQIAGDGRVKLGAGDREWWGNPPAERATVVEASHGQTYATREEAEQVATNLQAP